MPNVKRCALLLALAVCLAIPASGWAASKGSNQFNPDPYFDFLEDLSGRTTALGNLAAGYLKAGRTSDGLFAILLEKMEECHMADVNHFLDLALFKGKLKDEAVQKRLRQNAGIIMGSLDKDIAQLKSIIKNLDAPELQTLRIEYQRYLDTVEPLRDKLAKDVKALGLGK